MRDISPITQAILENELQEYWDFVKITFPSPIGILRYTDRPGGYTGNIDGTVQTWTETIFSFGGINQSYGNLNKVDWIVFADLTSLFKGLIYNPGIKNRLVSLYTGRWNVSTNALIKAYPIFEGKINDGEGEDEVRLSLKSGFEDIKIPYAKMGGRCLNDFMNPLDCQYPYTAGLTCAKTRAACAAYGNEININIYDDMPLPGETMMYGGANHGIKNLSSVE
jgi:hypothetical protein